MTDDDIQRRLQDISNLLGHTVGINKMKDGRNVLYVVKPGTEAEETGRKEDELIMNLITAPDESSMYTILDGIRHILVIMTFTHRTGQSENN